MSCVVFKDPAPKAEREETADFTPAFGPDGLIPCIVQDAESDEIVMFAFMNAEALAKTIETGEAYYWSRSRNTLWHKGATSGSIQTVHRMKTDCDQDVIVISVSTAGDGSNCHRGVKSCFYREVKVNRHTPAASTLETL